MFASLTRQQPAKSHNDLEPTPDLFFWLATALPIVTVWAVAAAVHGMGLPGGEIAAGFLDDTLELQIVTMVYVTVPLIVCALSDPMTIRLAIRTLTASLGRLLPQVALLFETLGGQTATLTVPAMPDSVRLAVRPQMPIPALRFSPGASPQLE